MEAISDAFFGSLPHGAFSPEEESLLNAIYEFLSCWSGKHPRTVAVMSQPGPVSEAKCTLLPKGISLKEWCEARVADDLGLAQTPSSVRGRIERTS